MKVLRRTETKVKLTETEFMEALGIDGEGSLQDIKQEWVHNYHREGAGATVIEVSLVQHRNDYKRKAAPRRKR